MHDETLHWWIELVNMVDNHHDDCKYTLWVILSQFGRISTCIYIYVCMYTNGWLVVHAMRERARNNGSAMAKTNNDQQCKLDQMESVVIVIVICTNQLYTVPHCHALHWLIWFILKAHYTHTHTHTVSCMVDTNCCNCWFVLNIYGRTVVAHIQHTRCECTLLMYILTHSHTLTLESQCVERLHTNSRLNWVS